MHTLPSIHIIVFRNTSSSRDNSLAHTGDRDRTGACRRSKLAEVEVGSGRGMGMGMGSVSEISIGGSRDSRDVLGSTGSHTLALALTQGGQGQGHRQYTQGQSLSVPAHWLENRGDHSDTPPTFKSDADNIRLIVMFSVCALLSSTLFSWLASLS